jgi:5'-methylthioinosine phosphorylase
MMSADLGLIVGSGFHDLDLTIASRSPTKTPYGPPSSPVLAVLFGESRLPCIVRHGENRKIPPHAVNYRANLWSLHQIGVRRCLAINFVGSIDPGLAPGELALPDQLIDYTWAREHTLYDGDSDVLAHIDFTEPFDPELRGRIASSAEKCGYKIRAGVCGVTQGPRLETAAEISRLERDGCSMVGMTAMPEAALARELGIAYAVCAVAANHAAGRGPGESTIHAELERYAALGMRRVSAILDVLIPDLLHEV